MSVAVNEVPPIIQKILDDPNKVFEVETNSMGTMKVSANKVAVNNHPHSGYCILGYSKDGIPYFFNRNGRAKTGGVRILRGATTIVHGYMVEKREGVFSVFYKRFEDTSLALAQAKKDGWANAKIREVQVKKEVE